MANDDPAMYEVLRDKIDALTVEAKPVGEMTVEQFRGLAEEIRGLWHMARRSRQVEIDGKLVDRSEIQQGPDRADAGSPMCRSGSRAKAGP